jgi:hypothetical protein
MDGLLDVLLDVLPNVLLAIYASTLNAARTSKHIH